MPLNFKKHSRRPDPVSLQLIYQPFAGSDTLSLDVGETDGGPLSCSRIDRDASALLDALDGRLKDRRPPRLASVTFGRTVGYDIS